MGPLARMLADNPQRSGLRNTVPHPVAGLSRDLAPAIREPITAMQ